MDEQNAYKKSSFGPAFFFLGRRKRQALAHYYAFCRLADDIVDEPSAPNPAAQLENLRQEVEFIYVGAPKTQLGQALAQDVKNFQLQRDRFTLLLEGMQADLHKKTYTSFEELQWYIYRVAVIVGKATLDILGVKGEKADALAQALGSAVQLTNIVRDVYEDARLGRVYLPSPLKAQDILANTQPQMVKQLCSQVAQKAKEQYAIAFELMDEFWPTTMLPCRIMGYVYQKNLAKIERAKFSFSQAIKLTKFEKLQMVAYALTKTFF